jgi:VWFA-related protein
MNTSAASFERARASLTKLFERANDTGGQFVLLTLSDRLRVIQTATADSSVLRAKLNAADFTGAFTTARSMQLSAAVNDVRRRMDSYCAACPCGRDASNRKSVCDAERQQIRNELEARADQFTAYGKSFLAGVRAVVEELAKVAARRTLILVSDGFELFPGKEMYATAAGYLPNSPYFKFDPARSLQPALDEILKIATARDIVLSAIDTRGVYSPSFASGGISDASMGAPGATGRQEVLGSRGTTNALRGGSTLDEMDSRWSSVQIEQGSVLAQLAEKTGGIYYHNSNDLTKGFRETFSEPGDTYVLAYVPTNPAKDGKFRRITVAVSANGVRPENLVVRSKSGYWADSPEPDR